tara:strand:+ start:2033 stop:2239 length:207 start_codon:yes stop_codon:yes gene_type:complete
MSPLFNEAQPIPLHAIAAMIAVIFGGLQFFKKKRWPNSQAVGMDMGWSDAVRISLFLLYSRNQNIVRI